MPVPETSIEQIIEGSARFTLRRRLGAGGMGVVYEAYDHQHDAVVALKTLRSVNPRTIYQFKQEFRALADVLHPNLVTLYELLKLEDQWFFTMELLSGRDVLAHLRDEPPAGLPDDPHVAPAAATQTAGSMTGVTFETPAPRVERARAEPVPVAVLSPVLQQLAGAIDALHSTGHLHCDIKPSNVLVTDEGRVVVLDYGVITTMTAAPGTSGDGKFRGTPAYAAPELVRDELPTAASDWYSFGVILYEALTGYRPFRGTVSAVLKAKLAAAPPPPHELNPDVDPGLAELCVRLLDRDPARRPTAAVIAAALEATSAVPETRASEPAPSQGDGGDPLVGRERELLRLREAFEHTRAGRGVAVAVKGRSGIGKSALVQHFLHQLEDREQPLILTGRCYERESVPHQAVDGLVDALCQYLLRLPRDRADALMPLDVPAMARAFPVLGRVEAVALARRRSKAAVSDPVELRTRAYAALRELFARLAEHQPLVLFIDDLQWGDVDSAPFLADLLRPPAPPLLLIVTYRSEEIASSALLQTLLGREESGQRGPLSGARKITIGQLSPAQARDLAATLLGPDHGFPETADQIARESEGNPFFIHELVRFVTSQADGQRGEVPALTDVLLSRVAALSSDARELLQVVAVAGRPLPEAVARRAAGLGAEHPRALAELRTSHMVRTTGADADATIEAYHDRIRESVLSSLTGPVLETTHRHIAESLIASDLNDPEALAIHYAGAKQAELACEHAELAADKAADALAFDRAVTFYQLALAHCAPDRAAARVRLGRKCGHALVNAGRGSEAWKVFLDAAAIAAPEEARDLQVLAGSELLRCGRVEDGVEVLRRPLASAGIALARSTAGAALSLLSRRAYCRLRGLGYRVREVSQIAPETLTQIDACHAAAAGLAMVDPLRGAYVQTRHLMSALRQGDRFRIGRALSYEAGFLSIGGHPVRKRVDRIASAVDAIAEELDEPYLRALYHTHTALSVYQCGEWKQARDHAQLAETIYRDECTGSAWERSSVQLYGLWSLFWLGEFRELSARTRASLREARARGDLYATVSLDIGLPSFAGLIADDIEGTRVRARDAARQWTHDGYHLQHFWAEMALAHCDLYAGDDASAAAAAERIEAQWPKLRSAFLLKVAMLRAETLFMRARCAVAAAPGADDPQRLRAHGRKLAAALARERMSWCRPAALLIEASLLLARGDEAQAVARLELAEEGLRASDTLAFAAAARHQRGRLMGGAAGEALVAESADWLASRGVADVDRMVRFLAPGLDPRSSADTLS